MRRVALAIASAAILLGAGTVLAATVTVHVGTYYFDDATTGDGKVVARVGDRIAFVFDDGGSHSANVDALGIASGPLGQGQTYLSPVLATPGTYELYCLLHRSRGHLATLVVTAVTPTPAPTPGPTPSPVASPSGSPDASSAPTGSPTGSTGPGPTATPGAGGPTPSPAPGGSTTAPGPTGSGAPPSGDPAAPSGSPSGSPDPGAPQTDDPGAVPPWVRSAWLALVAGIPIVLLALVADRLARRRRGGGGGAGGSAAG